MSATPETWRGRVVVSHGRSAVVAGEDGKQRHCGLFGRRLAVVCGDEVDVTVEGDDARIVAVHPRRTELARVSARGQAETVAANLTQLVAVVAPLPEPDLALCDRYLAAAAWAGLRAVVACNKADLPQAGSLSAALATYRDLGYRVVATSKLQATSIDTLAGLLRGQVSVLVGQSGVGKSSLTNRLVPGVEAEVRAVSSATEQGRHTTTASTLYRLPGGGDLIDSPGVRDFAPPLPPPAQVAGGFVEIAAAAAGCRFGDCVHDREPGCAVRAAVDAGRISSARFASYRQLLQLARQFSR